MAETTQPPAVGSASAHGSDLELLVAFDEAQEQEGRAPRTRAAKARILLRFAAGLDGHRLLEATTEDVEAWLATLRVTPTYRGNYVGMVSSFYRWAISERLIGYDPGAPLSRKHRPARDYGELHELLGGFRVAQERRGLSPGTITQRRYHLRRLAKHMTPRSILDATSEDLETFIDERGVSPKTRYFYLSTFHAFYRWAIREGIAEHNPTVNIDRPKIRANLPRPIADDDLILALAQATPTMRAWLVLAAFEGLRCGEIAGLQRQDVLDKNDPAMVLVSKGKGRRQRLVPLHPTVWEALRAHGLPRSGYVFTKVDGSPLPPWRITQDGGLYLHSLGIPASMHQLRHWFGTHLYARTRDLRMTQQMLGHSSPTTTSIYVAFSPGDAVEAVTGLAVSE